MHESYFRSDLLYVECAQGKTFVTKVVSKLNINPKIAKNIDESDHEELTTQAERSHVLQILSIRERKIIIY